MSEDRKEATPMTKRDIMIRAHEIARTLDGDYTARMAMALRRAWLEARLIQAGGRRWTKGEFNRIYFNNLAELYGLQLDYYNSGNISAAQLDGEHISNSSARQILASLSSARVWYDCNSGRFETKGLTEQAHERIMAALGAVAQMEVAA